jgi:4-amino-4-deoxy-L-arabinose transferase-like glycosyltransferase
MKTLEIILATVISAVTLAFFFTLLSANGLILGNDPAFHLGRAEMILASGEIPMGDFMWYPPLYHILLSAIIALTGATSIEQLLFTLKALTALIDWLLLASVYLIGAKFFGKKYGILASALMLLSLPLYEINSWGGYTSILSLAFMCLLFVYLPTIARGAQPVLITFFAAFSIVLSQQLGTFLAVFILPPFIVVFLISSKGKHSKALIAALLGGGIAFLIYYIQPIIARFGTFFQHVFFGIQTMAYQIPFVNLDSFLLDFGFVLFFAFFGLFLAFYRLRKEKKLIYFLILCLSLFVPLFFSQSYFFGLYLPYQMFVYFLLPPIAVFGAVFLSYIIDLILASYRRIKIGRKTLMKIATASLVIVMSLVLLFRFQTVGARINQGASFYSMSDVEAYDAAVWFKQSYPNSGTVVVTEKPGLWFGLYSDRMVVAETDPVIDRNIVAESVLGLSFEIENPLTLVRTLEAKGAVSDEIFVSINSVWKRVAFLSEQECFVSFTQNNVTYRFALSGLDRNISLEESGYPKKLVIKYFNDKILLNEKIVFQNDSYPINVGWELSSLRGGIDNASLYLSNYFDASFSFSKACVPGLLNWENPWNRPSYIAGNNDWALVDFSPKNMTDDYIGVYDDQNQVALALRFVDLPESGNVGVLANRMIDALRFQYQFGNLESNGTVSSSYQVLALSKSSYPDMQLSELRSMFDFKPVSAFEVETIDYADYIRQMNIEFVVYDKTGFDATLLRSNLLQQVYSNDKYVICKINNSSLA